jgi:hypothetical protein
VYGFLQQRMAQSLQIQYPFLDMGVAMLVKLNKAPFFWRQKQGF